MHWAHSRPLVISPTSRDAHRVDPTHLGVLATMRRCLLALTASLAILTAVLCVSAGAAWADDDGFPPPVGATPLSLTDDGSVESMSCPTSGFCATVTDRGVAFTSIAPTSTRPVRMEPRRPGIGRSPVSTRSVRSNARPQRYVSRSVDRERVCTLRRWQSRLTRPHRLRPGVSFGCAAPKARLTCRAPASISAWSSAAINPP